MQHCHASGKGEVNALFLNVLHAQILNGQAHDLTATQVLSIQSHGKSPIEVGMTQINHRLVFGDGIAEDFFFAIQSDT